MKKSIRITEKQLRQALGISGNSPLADRLVDKLFYASVKATTPREEFLVNRIKKLEKRLGISED